MHRQLRYSVIAARLRVRGRWSEATDQNSAESARTASPKAQVAMQQRRQGSARSPMTAVFMSVLLSISPIGGYERDK